jgi:hypothetical protein
MVAVVQVTVVLVMVHLEVLVVVMALGINLEELYLVHLELRVKEMLVAL